MALIEATKNAFLQVLVKPQKSEAGKGGLVSITADEGATRQRTGKERERPMMGEAARAQEVAPKLAKL